MDKKELVDLCKKRDERALSLLYSTYSAKLKQVCLRYVSDEQIAENLLHDGFIIIFTSIDALRAPEKLESWMAMIMKNLSLKYLNQLKATHTLPLSELEEWEEPMETLPSDEFPSYSILLDAFCWTQWNNCRKGIGKFSNWLSWKDCLTKKSVLY